MLHLSADRLAALGDDSPNPEECAHLAACDACARERGAFAALVGLARAEGRALGMPLSRWESIAGELALAEPVVHAPSRTAVAPVARGAWRTSRWPLQVAAGLLLCAGGAILGRMTAGASAFPERSATLAGRAGAAAVSAVSRSAAAMDDSVHFATIDEARAAQQRSQQVYERAAAFLAQYDSTAAAGNPVAYRSRLAALDQVLSTTRQAMREVPHDPVINEYYLTTIGQREATLRQLNTALPASLRLNSF